MNLLDNATWEALGSYHAPFAQSAAGARRYLAEVSPLCGVRDTTDPACWRDLAGLLDVRERIGLLLWDVPVTGPDIEVLQTTPLVQMTFTADRAALPAPTSMPYRDLDHRDAEAMIELVRLTKPGPMERRTVELGRYIGMHDDYGRLVALTGERARIPGWTEVSAVCTHPDARGRGLAQQLMLTIMHGILMRGELPFLHVAAANSGAQQLYRKLGFSIRRAGVHVLVRRAC